MLSGEGEARRQRVDRRHELTIAHMVHFKSSTDSGWIDTSIQISGVFDICISGFLAVHQGATQSDRVCPDVNLHVPFQPPLNIAMQIRNGVTLKGSVIPPVQIQHIFQLVTAYCQGV